MKPAIYGALTSWYSLLDPVEDHEGEVRAFALAIDAHVRGGAETLLELGSGAGNNLAFLSRRYACTGSDVSAEMLALSRAQCPRSEHHLGDMRTLRLDRTFDAVLIHDAITYMLTPDDLRAAMTTALVHTRPGGVVLLVPDVFAEGFRETTELHEADDGDRSLRAMLWSWDADPRDQRCTVEYALLLREGTEVTAVHDRHEEGLFSKATWLDLAREVGLDPVLVPRPLDSLDEHERAAYASEMIVCRRPER